MNPDIRNKIRYHEIGDVKIQIEDWDCPLEGGFRGVYSKSK